MKNKELLFALTKKDFTIEYYRGSGAGGQHRNKTESCCRIFHPESGAEARGTAHREQHRNREDAFKALCSSVKFKNWVKRKCGLMEMERAEIEKYVDAQMLDKNLKIEYVKNS